jgi:hypothetical protein
MSEQWDGVPENPERDGWHWLRRADGFTSPYRWTPGKSDPRNGFWLYPPDWELMPEDKMIARQAYLGPCLTPAEVVAREAASAEAMREACAAEHDEAAKRQAEPGPSTEFTSGFASAYERAWASALRTLPIPHADALSRALAAAEKRGVERAVRALNNAREEVEKQSGCGEGWAGFLNGMDFAETAIRNAAAQESEG